MTHTRLQRSMAHLALLAMLVMSLLPALGRLGAPPAATSTLALYGALCTATGLTIDADLALHEAMLFEAGIPADDHSHDTPDCAYCTLVAHALPPLMATPSTSIAIAATTPPGHAPPHLSAWLHPSGLGSRGPPA